MLAMKRKLITVLFILTLACLLLPAAALAANVTVGGTLLVSGTNYVNNTAKNGVVASGSTDYNVRYVENGSEGTLYLNGLDIERPDYSLNKCACVYADGFAAQDVNKLTVVINGTNTLITKNGSSQGGPAPETAALYISGGSVEISGSGQLSVTGSETENQSSYGVYVDNGSITIDGVNVNAAGGNARGESYGIYAKNGSLTIKSGTVVAAGGNARGESYGIYAKNGSLTIKSGTVVAAGGAAKQMSYGVYADGALTVASTLNATSSATGGASESAISCGAYVGGNLTVTGSISATGGSAALVSGNPYGGYSVGVQCMGDVYINNGSIIGKGGTVTTVSGDAISIGVEAKAANTFSITGNNGSISGVAGACCSASGSAVSYGISYSGSLTLGSSTAAEAASLSGMGFPTLIGGVSGGISCGVNALNSSSPITVNEGAMFTASGYNIGARALGNDVTVRGFLSGTGHGVAGMESYGINAGTGTIEIFGKGIVYAFANGTGTSESIGAVAGGGILMGNDGRFLASVDGSIADALHTAKQLKDSINSNALRTDLTAVWRESATGNFESIATYNGNGNNKDMEPRLYLEVKNGGNGLKAEPTSAIFGDCTVGTAVPAAIEITLHNTSGDDIALNVPAATYYTVTLPAGQTTIPRDSYLDVLVQPKASVMSAAGNYNEIIVISGTVTGSAVEVELSAELTVNAVPTVTLDLDPVEVDSGAQVILTATVRNGTTPYASYKWSDGSTTWQTTVNTTTYTPTANTTFTVQVLDANGVWSAVSGAKRVMINSYTVMLVPSSVDFGTLREGYSQPAASTVMVMNRGNQPINLEPISSTYYDVTPFDNSGYGRGW